MRRIRIIVAVVVLAAVLGGCTWLGGLFGPNKNNIMDWLKDLPEGARASYQERLTSSNTSWGLHGITYNYTIEVVDKNVRDTRTVVRVLFDGDTSYLIADDTRGQLVASYDDLVDAGDMIVLKVPVEEGTTWIGPLDTYIFTWVGFSTVNDARFTIRETKGTKTAGGTTVEDVVVLSVRFPDNFWAEGTVVSSAEIYYSPTHGWLGDRYVISEGGHTYTFETAVTDLDLP